MTRCGACGKFLSSTEGVKCGKCRSRYHRECVGISTTGPLSASWHCPECKKNVVRDNRADTPVKGHTQAPPEDSLVNLMDTSPIISKATDATTQELTVNDLRAEFKTFKEDLIMSIRNEFQVLRNELADLKSSVKTANDRISNLEERVAVMENDKQTHPQVSSDLLSTVAQLRSDINDRDQELLATDIQISNLPEASGENPIHTAMAIASKLGVKIELRDIVSAERVGGRRINASLPAAAASETRPRFLVVRLARRDVRDEILQAARVRRGMTSTDFDMPGPPMRVYVNERLTKLNRELFRRAREIGGRLGWQFIWSKRGRILARNKPGDTACLIRTEADLHRIFGSQPNSDDARKSL